MLLVDQFAVLVGKLVEGLLDCLDMISQDSCIRQLFDTTLHPNNALIVLIIHDLPPLRLIKVVVGARSDGRMQLLLRPL